MICGNIR